MKQPAKSGNDARARSAASKAAAAAAQPSPSPTPQPLPFVVAVAGSAGALDAIRTFFGNLAAPSGAAFLVCIHRDARAPELLTELMSRYTTLPVELLTDRAILAADTVYVLPTDCTLALTDARIEVRARAETGLQIDDLFCAVARDAKERSVGVLFSGMNADGTRGLQAIRASGGLALVQTPSTAAYETMPRSAIDAAAADVVDAPDALARRLVGLLAARPNGVRAATPLGDAAALDAILLRLVQHTGRDFSQYKRTTFLRRVERRMGLRQIADLPAYAACLEREPEETARLFKDLLIGVTSFFREPNAWEVLRTVALPQILARVEQGRACRIWIAGCSTGEEAYSMAIVARECLDAMTPPRPTSLQIYATDLDEASIERARRGLYSDAIEHDVSPERLARWFVKEEGGHRIRRELRDSVVFATQDLATDPPFTRLDVVCCRNVLIYLNAELQKRLLSLFYFGLNAGGFLVLGGAESLGSWERGFESIDAKVNVFRRRELPRGDATPVDFPLGARDGSFQRPMGAVEGWGAGSLAGRASPQESIRELVRIALDELGVAPKPKKRARRGVVAPSNVDALEGARTRILALTDELESFRREAQVTYEELQSTNEELKSTNEELVTSREETQSMNEELLSLNAELHGKNEALVGINDDMRNLLNSSQIPTLFLDNELRLKRFTTQATRIANVIPTDLGRPITDITLTLRDDTLARDVRRVLDTLVALETRVRTREGASFTMRIHPYRTAHDLIDGVVVSFVEITPLLHEAEARALASRIEAVVALVGEWPGVAYANDEESGQCIAVSRATETALGYPRAILAHATSEFWRSLRPAAERAETEEGPLGVAHPRQLRHAEGRFETFAETVTTVGDAGSPGRVRFVQLVAAQPIEPMHERS